MRTEPAIVLAALGSLLPGALIAYLGNAPAQYGYLLLLVALPFYCLGLGFLFLLLDAARRWFGLSSMRSYVSLAGLISGLLSVSLVPDGGWWSAVTFGTSLMTAFLLIPLIQGKPDC
jgi:hypothetical protein